MPVRVDEPGRDHPAGDVDDLLDIGVGDRPKVADGEDPVGQHADVGRPARRPCTVDERSTAEQEVAEKSAGRLATYRISVESNLRSNRLVYYLVLVNEIEDAIGEIQERPVRVALLNAFGFGSNNAAVVFRQAPQRTRAPRARAR